MSPRTRRAEMAELVDAVDSKSTARKGLRVRVPLSAPYLCANRCALKVWRFDVEG